MHFNKHVLTLSMCIQHLHTVTWANSVVQHYSPLYINIKITHIFFLKISTFIQPSELAIT